MNMASRKKYITPDFSIRPSIWSTLTNLSCAKGLNVDTMTK